MVAGLKVIESLCSHSDAVIKVLISVPVIMIQTCSFMIAPTKQYDYLVIPNQSAHIEMRNVISFKNVGYSFALSFSLHYKNEPETPQERIFGLQDSLFKEELHLFQKCPWVVRRTSDSFTLVIPTVLFSSFIIILLSMKYVVAFFCSV